jgi:bifunctional UDP-N-acetylglucosamine pyrophosphorylase / glucosamine-1-phosphate N-acetyltransferase
VATARTSSLAAMGCTVIVMAAGQGTRMRSATPKVLHDLCGRPLVAWPIAAAREAGASRVLVVQGPERPLDGRLPEGVETVVQPVADGTGGAVAAALPLVADERVVVLSGDAPLVRPEEVAALLHDDAEAAMLTAVLDEPGSLGRVIRTPEGEVDRVAEAKAPGDATPEELAVREVNSGTYAFATQALRRALDEVGTDNAQGERYLPDVLPRIRAAGGRVVAVQGSPDVVLGVNDRRHLAEVRAVAQARLLEAHMLLGVTVVDPAHTYVDAGVVVGADTTLHPGTVLRGTTRIGEGCSVGPHVVAVDAVLEDGASAGPFAYLRPGTVLRAGAKAGTFVEIKNSDIGEGTKVPHLSYVGDADVGPGSNLGAGTITANYDGRAKHRTTIGAGVRSSVHVSFVAPVSVGDRAWTGAGSVITSDVPAGALGIARERQVNVEGYDDRRRP